MPGCTAPLACNFMSTADVEDGSCLWSCYSCTDSTACNWDPSAPPYEFDVSELQSNWCTYPITAWRDCFGDCLNDDNFDFICNEEDHTHPDYVNGSGTVASYVSAMMATFVGVLLSVFALVDCVPSLVV